MTIRKFCLIIIVSILSHISLASLAEESLADMVKAKAENAKGAAQSGHSTDNIPGYSEKEKQTVEQELGSLEVGVQMDQLKSEGGKVRTTQVRDNPNGAIATMVEAADLKRVKGFEGYSKLEIFTKADKYMQDPIGQMSLISDKGCKEKINNKKRGFVRKESKETFTDDVEELRSCEVPVNKFKCSKVLEVSCKKTAECDYGGVQEGSAKIEGGQNDPNKVFKFVNGNLEIGLDTKGNNLYGTCATFDKSFVFNVENKDFISSFKMVYTSFDDYLQLKLNGHTFYVGPDGGSGVEVVARQRRNWRRIYHENVVYNGNQDRPCERGQHWNIDKEIELKEYLKEGSNVLDMRVIVSGEGKGFLRLKVKRICCGNNDWHEKWTEHCEQTN